MKHKTYQPKRTLWDKTRNVFIKSTIVGILSIPVVIVMKPCFVFIKTSAPYHIGALTLNHTVMFIPDNARRNYILHVEDDKPTTQEEIRAGRAERLAEERQRMQANSKHS